MIYSATKAQRHQDSRSRLVPNTPFVLLSVFVTLWLIISMAKKRKFIIEPMKRALTIILSFIFLGAVGYSQPSTTSRSIKPTGYVKKITTVSEGKNRSYYALSNVDVSVINVQGPGILKVHTRGQFRPGDPDQVKYTVVYSIDGGVQKSIPVSDAVRSKNATYADGTLGLPGELKTFEIELTRGSHTVEFKLQDITRNVAARYVFTPAKLKKQEWLAFSPMLPSEPVDLVSRESATAYYRFSMAKPLRIEIIGPTELRVLTRTENHFQMKGRINYRVQVKENGNVINTYQLYSKTSDVAVYKDVKDLIPGTACEFVIYVPDGVHHYEILPLDKDKPTLLGRLLIPKKDIKLEVK